MIKSGCSPNTRLKVRSAFGFRYFIRFGFYMFVFNYKDNAFFGNNNRKLPLAVGAS